MSIQVLNYPRKVRTEKERIAAVIATTPGTTLGLPFIYITQEDYVANVGIVAQSIASLTSGGTVLLGPGTFYNDPTAPTTPLTIPANTIMAGAGPSTIFKSPVLMTQGACSLRDMSVIPTAGSLYGVKIYTSGGGTARCHLSQLYIGAIDATARDAGDGPDKGLWLDGAILTEIDHCTIACCTDSGLYINTSNATYSTNVNTFRTCTFNANLRYGVEILQGVDGIGGIISPRFDGGNMELNVLGEFYADQTTNLEIRGVDFESHEDMTAVISLSGCNPAMIENCNFVKDPANTITYIFSIDSCVGATVKNCRESGTGWGPGTIGIFTSTCVGCRAEDFRFVSNGCYIVNRGYQ